MRIRGRRGVLRVSVAAAQARAKPGVDWLLAAAYVPLSALGIILLRGALGPLALLSPLAVAALWAAAGVPFRETEVLIVDGARRRLTVERPDVRAARLVVPLADVVSVSVREGIVIVALQRGDAVIVGAGLGLDRGSASWLAARLARALGVPRLLA
jgi:hypothetical protein